MMTVQRRYLSGCFLAGGLGFGLWGANLPALGRKAALSEAELGLVLLSFAVGAVIAMGLAPALIRRLGPGQTASAAAGLFGLSLILVSVPVTMLAVAGVAACMGGFFGLLDVSMNEKAAAVEKAAGRPVMSSFHAVFSLGTLLSALAYAGLVRAGLPAELCVRIMGLAVIAAALAGWTGLRGGDAVPAAATGGKAPAARGQPDRRTVLMLGAVAFLAFLSEGAILDWIAVYVVRVVGLADSSGALAYAAFAVAMTLGRFLGDRVRQRWGAPRVFRAGALMLIGGLAGVLLFPSLPVLIAGMMICGFGNANLAPLLFLQASHLGERDGGRSMSTVLTMGYAGILVGPAVIGFLAEGLGLRGSLWVVVLALCALTAGHRLLRRGI